MKKTLKIVAVMLVAIMSLAMLVACAPASDPDKAVAALKKDGYVAVKVDSVLGLGGLVCTVSGTKIVTDKEGNKKVETVTIHYYGSSDQAAAAFENVKSDSEKDENKNESDWTVAKSGKMVYYGTKAAINAAR